MLARPGSPLAARLRRKPFSQFLRRRAPAQLVQPVCALCARRLPQNMHIPAGEIQVISPTRKGETGTANLNRALQAARGPPQPGRRGVPSLELTPFHGTDGVFRRGERRRPLVAFACGT